MRSKRSTPFGLIATAAILTVPFAAQAITLLPPCIKTGDCGITDLLAVFANIAEIILGISGALALGFFIWGGFQMILSAGNADKVKQGKETITRAVIGIFIIFMSGVIVRFTSEALTGNVGNVCSDVPANKSLKDPTKKTYVDVTGKSCVPKLGDSCASIAGKGADGIWVSIPGGYTKGSTDPAADLILEGLVCIKKNFSAIPPAGCDALNTELDNRSRPEAGQYKCISTSDPKASRCVRGLCGGGADFACCIQVAPPAQQ